MRLGSQQAKPLAFSVTHNRGKETSLGSKDRNAGFTYEWKAGQRTCRVILKWSFPNPDNPTHTHTGPLKHPVIDACLQKSFLTRPNLINPFSLQSLLAVLWSIQSSKPQVYARSQDLSQTEPSKAIPVMVREEKKPRVYLLSKSWWILMFTVALYLEFLTTPKKTKTKKKSQLIGLDMGKYIWDADFYILCNFNPWQSGGRPT